ncbi:hypothetical protein RRF57_011628 [Xylaria bambusicola]|uniref:Uncharacterized protein n=1 Tax=Xylaria bambusicola TaxID=326684 RepID=A0AAN7ZD97_9PEZI
MESATLINVFQYSTNSSIVSRFEEMCRRCLISPSSSGGGGGGFGSVNLGVTFGSRYSARRSSRATEVSVTTPQLASICDQFRMVRRVYVSQSVM